MLLQSLANIWLNLSGVGFKSLYVRFINIHGILHVVQALTGLTDRGRLRISISMYSRAFLVILVNKIPPSFNIHRKFFEKRWSTKSKVSTSILNILKYLSILKYRGKRGGKLQRIPITCNPRKNQPSIPRGVNLQNHNIIYHQ